MDRHGLALRPHIKVQTLSFLAWRQVAVAAALFACVCALANRVALTVTDDTIVTVNGLSEAFANRARTLGVMVECDTGTARCGVPVAEAALDLARAVERAAGLRYAGLMTYPASGQAEANAAWLADAVRHLTHPGRPRCIVSDGATPDRWRAHEVEAAIEHRPGTSFYLDRYQVAWRVGSVDDFALTLRTTAVSRPTGERAAIDAGSKVLTGLDGFGLLIANPDAVVRGLREELGVVDLDRCATRLHPGERICIIPDQACPVSDLSDAVTLVSGGRMVETGTATACSKVRQQLRKYKP